MQLTRMLGKMDQSSLWPFSAIQWNPFIHDYMPFSAAKSSPHYKDRSLSLSLSLSLSFSMDQKKQATTAASKPLGMCEKLFSAFQPALRPLHRLTFRPQEGTAASHANSSLAAASQGLIPHSKLPVPVAPPPGKSKLPKVLHTPKPKHQEKPLPMPAAPKAKVGPLVPVPQPLPPPPPPLPLEVQKPRKGISEKVDEYNSRTKDKIRSTFVKVG